MLKVGIFSLCLYLALGFGLTEGRVYDTDELSFPARMVEYIGKHPEVLNPLSPPGPTLSPQPTAVDVLCSGCLTAVGFMKSLILIGVKWPAVRDQVVAVCNPIVSANGWHADIVCPGAVDAIGPIVYGAVKDSRKSSKKICVHMNWCDPYEAPSLSSERPKRDLSNAYIDRLQHILNDINLDNFQRRGNVNLDKDKDSTHDTKTKSSVDDTSFVPFGIRTDDFPMISKMLKDLHMDETVFSRKFLDLIKLASSPENWKLKLPLKKLQALSKHLDEQLKKAMANVEAKSQLKPNVRKMANLIASALTRTARRTKRHLSENTENYMKVLQLADMHVELNYKTGEATSCGLPFCCRPDFPPGTGEAGVWGDKDCDTSPETIRKLIRHAAAHNPDFVIYSGDNPPHTVWMETLEGQLNASRWVAGELAAGFPTKTVYPNIGNHENYPLNMYSVPREETKILNREWANMFKGIAKFGDDQLETINKAGYYTSLVKSGLRIIALNTNYGGVGNILNLVNYDLPEYKEMILWLEQTLAHARNASEKVFLFSHHEYGMMEMVVAFDEDIIPILVEYSDIIMWHPVGHVHRDEYRINFDPATGLPVGVVFEAMCMNTYPNVNPGYRVWYIDPDTYQPIDYEQYNVDLVEANANPDGEGLIHLAYKASTEYGLDDLSPASMFELYQRIMTNNTLLQRYWSLRRSSTGADGYCDEQCRLSEQCHMIASTYDVYRACMRGHDKNETQYGSNAREGYAKLWDHPEGKMAAFGSSSTAAVQVSGVSCLFSLIAFFFIHRFIMV